MNRDLPGRELATRSPSAGWRMLCDWFLPKTVAEQFKLQAALIIKMENVEEPIT